MKRFKTLVMPCLAVAGLTLLAGGAAGAQTSKPEGRPASDQANEATGSQVVAEVVGQSFEDGPNGTVFTLTELRSLDGVTVTVQTHGGINSDGIGQYTSHEPRFTVGATYAMNLTELVDRDGAQHNGAQDGGAVRHRVLGGEDGLIRVAEDGGPVVEALDAPDNFTLLPYSWKWTLPDNPPQFRVNPNARDVANEVDLVRAGFITWESYDGAPMDWTFRGTTSDDVVANDNRNVAFWADTPDPADSFVARSTTFYIPSTRRAIDTDIVFNRDYNWADGAAENAYDVVSVAIQESGHSLGLGDAPGAGAVMSSPILPNTTRRTLSDGDRAGVAALFARPEAVAAVAGRVSFSDGAAAPNVKLNLFTENRAQFLGASFTNDTGDYGFELASAGCYVMTFIAPPSTTFVATGNGFQNRSFCVGPDSNSTEIDAVLLAPGSETTSSGRVTSTDGSPAEGVKVNLFTDARARFLGFTGTDQQGDYSFNLLGAGCYVTVFIAPEGSTFVQSGGRYLERRVCANQGDAVTGIDAVLDDPPVSATLGDRVTNADGSGQAGVKVVLYRANGDGSRGQWLGPAFTDADGFYRFTPDPGCYVLDFVAPDGRTWATTGGRFQQLSSCVDPGETDDTLDGVLN